MPKLLSEVFARYKNPSFSELYEAVKEIRRLQQHQGDTKNQGYHDRLQRASSWLAKAKKAGTDSEARFIFLWIALNALCAVRPDIPDTSWWRSEEESPPPLSKRRSDDKNPRELEWFLWRVCGLDGSAGILRSVIEAHRDNVKTVLRTRYLMSNYWFWKWRTEDELSKWKISSQGTINRAIHSVGDRELTYRALGEILVWRLRTLRNQLFHGCATDTHSTRRADGESELEAGSSLLEELIWKFLVLMASESGQSRYWPPCPYPRAGSAQHQPFDDSWLPKCGGRNAPFQ